jgi:hypothetical protein
MTDRKVDGLREKARTIIDDALWDAKRGADISSDWLLVKLLTLLQQDTKDTCPEPPQELIDGIAKHLLAEWIAIDKGETRNEALKYIDDAQELFDYLYVIGFRNVGSGKVKEV